MAITEIRPRTRYSLPSVLMRAGTSKGLFIHTHNLPTDKSKWGAVLLAAMGSREGDRKQIDGVGGATSTTSKVAIVSKSSRPDADVDYTFAQVAVGQGKVDFSGNCGNMASGVGPFALDEGLVQAKPGQNDLSIRIFNTNTKRLLISTIKVDPNGAFDETGDYHISGVLGSGSEIKVSFLDPAGSMTGSLFPTETRKDELIIPSTASIPQFTVTATLIDAANPFIFIDSATLPTTYHAHGPSHPQSLALIESIRLTGAVRFGLAESIEAAALVRGTPKIAVLLPRGCEQEGGSDDDADIAVTAYSMGKVHPTLQLTGAVCLGAAVCVEGTVPYELSRVGKRQTQTPRCEIREPGGERIVRIRHGSGIIGVAVEMAEGREANGVRVEKVTVSRTARRLFEGNVLFNL